LLDIILPKISSVTSSDNYGRFQIEPLEPGFGVTVGNALRRVLISSLPGAAVTSIRIDEVYHEFSDIPGVKEDTTDLILNLKQLRLRLHSDRPAQIVLRATGPGRVVAADIICPPEVEIVNPELYIATLDSPESNLNIEMTVEKGKGYVPSDHREGMPIGVIPVDAVFTPIRKVNYTLEHTRVGQVTDYDRLILEIWTDGTVSPSDALSQSAEILMRHLTLLTDLAAKPSARPEKQVTAASTIPSKVYDVPIEDLDLSVRAYNCLKRAGITKVGQILEMTEEDLLGVRNFGHKSLDELIEKLQQRDFLAGSRLAESMAEREESEAETPKEEEEAGEVQEETPEPPKGADEHIAAASVETEEDQVESEVEPEIEGLVEEPVEAPEEEQEELPGQLTEDFTYDYDFVIDEDELEEEEEAERRRRKRRR